MNYLNLLVENKVHLNLNRLKSEINLLLNTNIEYDIDCDKIIEILKRKKNDLNDKRIYSIVPMINLEIHKQTKLENDDIDYCLQSLTYLKRKKNGRNDL